MRIFISHPIVDLELAEMLKEILERNTSIEEAYIAINRPEYQLDIPEKILKEIGKSDYLVAIITVNTFQSASVHQEIGYAQGVGPPRIPMIEENAKAGFLHDSKDRVIFNRDNFISACNKVLEYIIANGPTRKKYTNEEAMLIQRSAHYRYSVHNAISHILDSIFLRLNMGDDAKRYELFSTKNASWNKNSINYIKKFLKKDTEELISHFSQIKFEYFRKLNDMGYDDFLHELNHAKRFPHIEKFQEETNILIKLEEYIRNLPPKNFNLIEYVQLHYNLTPKESDTCSEILKNENIKYSPLRKQMKFIISDLLELIDILNILQDMYIGYKRKFGDIAFKK